VGGLSTCWLADRCWSKFLMSSPLMFFMSSMSDSTLGGGTTSEDFVSSPGISNRSSKNFGS